MKPFNGVDRVERRSLLEQNGVYTLDEYQRKIKQMYGKNVVVVGDADRGCVSPLAGLAKPNAIAER